LEDDLAERRYFNMTAFTWRQLRRSWKLPPTPQLLWQSSITGPLFSALNSCQGALTAERRRNTSLAGSIVVLGYWRSGTTLLHNYLARDRRFGFPSTYACMHPQHFVLTQSAALERRQATVLRPMDDVRIGSSSPQEEEFGLLALGARSPYEALLAPCHLADALALGDPRDLPADEKRHWEKTFQEFLGGVSVVEGNRPLILKSPPHGYRVVTLRQLLPDARFVLIVRSPDTVYESTVRMWRSLFPIYALGAIPPEDDTRRVVLADRPRFETKLAEGVSGLPQERFALIHYETLVRDPLNTIGNLYEQFRLGNFADVETDLKAEIASAGQYKARNAAPPDYWMQQVRDKWRSVFEQYNY
jgi:omega-hydroxy-beta-dihydromenaquinone-9 sulfotransferase